MKIKIVLIPLALAATAAIAITTARADGLDVRITGNIRLGLLPPPPPPAVVVVVDDVPHGPAQWEHGRWYHRNQGYYYYPGGDAYYRPSDHVWFYLERGQWRSGRNLPEWVHIDFNRSVTLSMATDRPYAFHQQVVARYPSDYFGTRVRLRDDDRRDHGDDNRRHDGDKRKGNHGKSNDHDKPKDHDKDNGR